VKEEQPVRNIEPNDLPGNAEEYRKNGFRFVQACCTKLAENIFEITYSFDKDYKFENLRITVTQETEIPSVSGVYKGTFLYENEIRELFGVNIKGINVDYNGHLYKKKMNHPFNTDTNKADETCQRKQ